MRALLAILAVLVAAPTFADEAPVDVRTRETALAATIDMEFQDTMAGDFSGAVILEQDGKVSLRAGYGFADVDRKTPFTVEARVPTGIMTGDKISAFWTSSAADIYAWYRSARVQDDLSKGTYPSPVSWETRKADDGHTVQISRKVQNGVFLSYFCWRPDDGVFLYFVASGGEKENTALLNRVMTSVRDAGKMPVTNFH